MILSIEKIEIELIEDQYGLKMTAFENKYPLPGQTLEETQAVLTKNFDIVKEKYLQASLDIIDTDDLHEVCMKIVLHYFYLYNTWKSMYEKDKNRDLTFLDKDFNHPNTYDKIIHHFKYKYPNDYAEKCAVLMGKSKEEVLQYEANTNDFYNSFR